MTDFYSFSPYSHLREMMEKAGRKVTTATRFDNSDVREAYRRDYISLCFAVSAAESKAEKPPIRRGQIYSCATCRKHISKEMKYCPQCGQKVRWEK